MKPFSLFINTGTSSPTNTSSPTKRKRTPDVHTPRKKGANYLEKIKYWENEGFGFWEEGPKELRSSSLAACLRGIESFKKILMMRLEQKNYFLKDILHY